MINFVELKQIKMIDLQLDITNSTLQMLEKEATETNLPISKLVSNLLENYFSIRQWQKKQESVQATLIELAQLPYVLEMTEEEMNDFINAEIKAYREEKRQNIKNP